MVSSSLPIIDITALTALPDFSSPTNQKASEALYTAFSNIGFAIVVGHGVSPIIIESMRTAVKTIFDTPRPILAKQLVEKGNYRGYVPLGFFTPNSGEGEADQYEAWKLHTETPLDAPICQRSSLYGPNRWPEIEHDVKTPILAYWAAMTQVSTAVLSSLCQIMKLDTDLILSYLTNPLTNMTLLNYPPLKSLDSWGIHPHKDFDFLTILAHDPVGGLEVRNRDGDWIQSDCPPEGLIINIGDMLELLSGGRLKSTPHRVTNHSGQARQSFPYFVVPRFDVIIEPLLPPLPGFDRDPLHVGQSNADIWYSNWPDEASSEPGQVLDFD